MNFVKKNSTPHLEIQESLQKQSWCFQKAKIFARGTMSPLFKWCQLPFIEPKKKGAFATVAKKLIMEERCKVTGEALRIEKALYWTDEGKSSLDCPIAKSTIRRKKQVEKYLVITKDRNNHKCKYK